MGSVDNLHGYVAYVKGNMLSLMSLAYVVYHTCEVLQVATAKLECC